jgi:glycosidase
MKRFLTAALVAILMISANNPVNSAQENTGDIIYFVMTDRFFNGDSQNDLGGFAAERSKSGYDPTDVGFYHGGDIAGLMQKIPYIKSLGFTAIWITPVVKQLPLSKDGKSSAYHGYWGIGFDQLDPHLGTMQEFKEFVNLAHQNSLKVILDIVVNHTANVIELKDTSYIPLTSKPYKTSTGKKIDLINVANNEKFPPLSQWSLSKSFPKTPTVSKSLKNIKSPAWLNDLRNYHNRGDSTFQGESIQLGDFFGLDDLMTESPIVTNGFIKVFSDWIINTGIDGFRIDTARHVNEGFWRQFLPAMRAVAASQGKSYFPMWGEVYDAEPMSTAYWVRQADYTEVLDFAFQSRTVNFINNRKAEQLGELFNDDDLYISKNTNADNLGTFLGNHDMGRIGAFISPISVGADDLKKDQLAHAILLTLRGIPSVYYGDEYGLTGGEDKEARQDLFPTQVKKWQSQHRIGGEPIGSASAFDTKNPMIETIKSLNQLRSKSPALFRGSQRTYFAKDGTLAFGRYDAVTNSRFMVAFNSNSSAKNLKFDIDYQGTTWQSKLGNAIISQNQRSISIDLPPFGWGIFEMKVDLNQDVSISAKAKIFLDEAKINIDRRDQFVLSARVENIDFASVEFQIKDSATNSNWRSVGIDRGATFSTDSTVNNRYRVFPFLNEVDWKSNPSFRVVATLYDKSTITSEPKSLANLNP